MTKNDERKVRFWVMLCHLGAIFWLPIYLFLPIFIPLLNIFVPLIIWRNKKSEHLLIDINGKNSINFQISTTIYMIIWMILVLFMATDCGSSLGEFIKGNSELKRRVYNYLSMFSLPALLLGFLQFFCSMSAAITTYIGKSYDYPLTIRFLK
ncbi:DUF4870 domain-containing protein [Nostoc sp. 106C]|jgi:uncharacterized Tic20 family protein|uniref:DUF4870 domain-containing protein n=1 Tax=Nostoc sp. 106C TaxID=1932667 RepID=UPI000A3891D5|nr:DUF4870 domain-containing protein [Nostoc sp. 106C]OUL19963.1 hypothetical protein BV378_30910 [Nostoc sp. RF31YmG]OUL21610.1 hypothetical protein BV375_29180 [Nostoc sp. 106C]